MSETIENKKRVGVEGKDPMDNIDMAKQKPTNPKIDQAYKEFTKSHYEQGIKTDVQTMLGVIFGSALMSISMTILLKPGHMIAAGFSGLAMFLQSLFADKFGVNVPFVVLSLSLNLIPIIMAFKTVGRKFTIFSCFALVLSSVLNDILPLMFNGFHITDERILIAVFGGIINGFGVGFILRSGACGGGTDFIAMYFSVRKGISTFKYVFFFNCIIVVSFGFIYGADSALYTIVYQFVNTQMINYTYRRYDKKTLLIITKKPQEVADAIMGVTHHACTIINNAIGAYSGDERSILYMVVNAEEIDIVRRYARGTDTQAFINTLSSDLVTGNFFQRPIL
ncbi:MAG: YitT family protein [Sphaerochaetaceae bacterium]|nr:YitT family protein [Sphaerochaetaceae bacterium]